MPNKSLRFCNHHGCSELSSERFCPEHMKEFEAKEAERIARYDKARGNAQQRGYDARWQKYSKQFLSKADNQICALHLPGCTMIAKCVDHIDPPDGPSDPRFWDKSNHQPACIRCNSVKGHKKIVGTYEM